jgi:hypothetical protein
VSREIAALLDKSLMKPLPGNDAGARRKRPTAPGPGVAPLPDPREPERPLLATTVVQERVRGQSRAAPAPRATAVNVAAQHRHARRQQTALAANLP